MNVTIKTIFIVIEFKIIDDKNACGRRKLKTGSRHNDSNMGI